METALKTATSVNPKVNDKWYNIRRFMGEKTQENLAMGYSVAYPTGRELGEKWGSDGVESGGVGDFKLR